MELDRWHTPPDVPLLLRLMAAREQAAVLAKRNLRLKVDAVWTSAMTEATVLQIGVERHLRDGRPAGPGHGAAGGSARPRSR